MFAPRSDAAAVEQLRAARRVLIGASGFTMLLLAGAFAVGVRGWLLVGVAGGLLSLLLQVLVLSVLIRRDRGAAVDDDARAEQR